MTVMVWTQTSKIRAFPLSLAHSSPQQTWSNALITTNKFLIYPSISPHPTIICQQKHSDCTQSPPLKASSYLWPSGSIPHFSIHDFEERRHRRLVNSTAVGKQDHPSGDRPREVEVSWEHMVFKPWFLANKKQKPLPCGSSTYRKTSQGRVPCESRQGSDPKPADSGCHQLVLFQHLSQNHSMKIVSIFHLSVCVELNV